MSREKQTRLFILLAVSLVMLVGFRIGVNAVFNRRPPQWTEFPGPGVAQAASGSIDESTPTQSSSVSINPQGVTNPATNTDDNHTASVTAGIPSRLSSGSSSSSVVVTAPADTSVTFVDTTSLGVSNDTANAASTCTNPSGATQININKATIEELDALPGIGPSIASAIIEERIRRGGFERIDNLLDVRGIGQARFATLAPLVCVASSPEL